MLRVLEEQNFPIASLKLLASPRSAGIKIPFRGTEYTVEALGPDSFHGVQIALFSAGGQISKEFAPIAAASGCIVIDNSSAWRMHEHVPLIVPEVNSHAMANHHGIIANPNCSTIQLVVALQPLQQKYGLQRVIVSTYQSVSGAGQKGVDHLQSELRGENPSERISPHQLAYNTVFHSFLQPDIGAFTEEEEKIRRETRRIMDLSQLRIAVTCVRIPVMGGHAESVLVELQQPYQLEEIQNLLRQSQGIVVMDNPSQHEYPTPVHVHHRDDVYIGRLRRDDSSENGLYMWVVADNLRKGAATNAVQIASSLIQNNYLHFTPAKW
jgi:aspartate-semialdehyde dehydrogenase